LFPPGGLSVVGFLNELDRNFQDQVDRMLFRLEETARRGPSTNPDICRKIGQEIWEFREGRIRVLWFYGEYLEVIICSHGFLKRTQKTPKTEKQRAFAARKQYFGELAHGDLQILGDENALES
jgi:phage-related protein